MIWFDLVILKFCFWKVYFFPDAKTSWWYNLLSPTQISQGLKCLVGHRQSFSHDRAWKKTVFGLTQRVERPCRNPVLTKRKAKEGRFWWLLFFFFFLTLLNVTIRGRYLTPFPRSTSLGKDWAAGREKAWASLINCCFCWREWGRDTKRCHCRYFSFTEISKFEHLKEKNSRWIFYWIINEL